MAQIVAGFASSHTPLMSLPGELWAVQADNDYKNRELVQPGTGKHMSYQQLLAEADPGIAKVVNVETFKRRFEHIQRGLDSLKDAFAQVNPDVVVAFGDDQAELFYFDNYPTIHVYWGDQIKMIPRQVPDNASEARKISSAAYGTEEYDYPGQPELGLHIIETLMDKEFDVAHSKYQPTELGGDIGPATWYLDFKTSIPKRRMGLAHAFAFPICRWFAGKKVPMVPITLNTCYPPNWIGPKRAYNLGRAVRDAILNWKSDARVAIVTSGGLSHFTVDEELDRHTLKALSEANGDALCSLPRHRLQSATTETLNWVAAAGAMAGTPMEVITYEPGYRTPAGTGCGCACGQWMPN
jgi:hypothetical protein